MCWCDYRLGWPPAVGCVGERYLGLAAGSGVPCVGYRVSRVACGGHYCVQCVVRVLLEDGAVESQDDGLFVPHWGL